MTNPCRRDCPDRTPGCNCEKRKAWKFQQEQIKAARRNGYPVRFYFRDTMHRLKRNGYLPRDK